MVKDSGNEYVQRYLTFERINIFYQKVPIYHNALRSTFPQGKETSGEKVKRV